MKIAIALDATHSKSEFRTSSIMVGCTKVVRSPDLVGCVNEVRSLK
ncbi:hypothetical protein H6G96_11300 [Nostoc sp. FACHB-892]|nr:hypothetical protein [Nostoc sp. FACHB-892]MBD2726901.1 hypothetical protein [Nostoc sp. FACHB-892]